MESESEFIGQILFCIQCNTPSLLKLSPFLHLQLIWGESPLGLLRWLSGKESAFQCRRCKRCELDPWVRKIPWRRKWQPTPVFFPGEPHRQRSLVGYSPKGLQRVRHS